MVSQAGMVGYGQSGGTGAGRYVELGGRGTARLGMSRGRGAHRYVRAGLGCQGGRDKARCGVSGTRGAGGERQGRFGKVSRGGLGLGWHVEVARSGQEQASQRGQERQVTSLRQGTVWIG